MSNQRKNALLRIAFGGVWGIDAYFKWLPDFLNNFATYLPNNAGLQPHLVEIWLNFWSRIIAIDPILFAIIIAIAETAIAIALILGVAKNITTWGGVGLSIIIWSTAEAFGGPYTAGSTDIGA